MSITAALSVIAKFTEELNRHFNRINFGLCKGILLSHQDEPALHILMEQFLRCTCKCKRKIKN